MSYSVQHTAALFFIVAFLLNVHHHEVEAAFDIPASGPYFTYANQAAFFQDVNLVLSPGTFKTTDPATTPCGIDLSRITQAGRVNITGTMGNGCFIKLSQCSFVTLEIPVEFEDGQFESFIELDRLTGSGNPQYYTLKIANTAKKSYVHRISIRDSTFKRNGNAFATSPDHLCTYHPVYGHARLAAVCIQATHYRSICPSIVSASSSSSSVRAPTLEILGTTIEATNWDISSRMVTGLILSPSMWTTNGLSDDTSCYNISIVDSSIVAAGVPNLQVTQTMVISTMITTVPQIFLLHNSKIFATDATLAYGMYLTNHGDIGLAPQHPLSYVVSKNQLTGLRYVASATASDSFAGAAAFYFDFKDLPMTSAVKSLSFETFSISDNSLHTRGDSSSFCFQFEANFIGPLPSSSSSSSFLQRIVTFKGNTMKMECGASCAVGGCISNLPANHTDLVEIRDNFCNFTAEGGTMAAMTVSIQQNVKRIVITNNTVYSSPTDSRAFGKTTANQVFNLQRVTPSEEFSFLNNTVIDGGCSSNTYPALFGLAHPAAPEETSTKAVTVFGNTFESRHLGSGTIVRVTFFQTDASPTEVLNVTHNSFYCKTSTLNLVGIMIGFSLTGERTDINAKHVFLSDNTMESYGMQNTLRLFAFTGGTSDTGYHNFSISDSFEIARNQLVVRNTFDAFLIASTVYMFIATAFGLQGSPIKKATRLDCYASSVLIIDNAINIVAVENSKAIVLYLAHFDSYNVLHNSVEISRNSVLIRNPALDSSTTPPPTFSSVVYTAGMLVQFRYKLQLSQLFMEDNVFDCDTGVQVGILLVAHDSGLPNNVNTTVYLHSSSSSTSSSAPPTLSFKRNRIFVRKDVGKATAKLFWFNTNCFVDGPNANFYFEHNILSIYSPPHFLQPDGEEDNLPTRAEDPNLIQLYGFNLKSFIFRNNVMTVEGPRARAAIVALSLIPPTFEDFLNFSSEMTIENNFARGQFKMFIETNLGHQQQKQQGTFTMRNNTVESLLTSITGVDVCEFDKTANRYKIFAALRVSKIRNTFLIENNTHTFHVANDLQRYGDASAVSVEAGSCWGLQSNIDHQTKTGGGGGYEFTLVKFYSFEPWKGMNGTDRSLSFGDDDDDHGKSKLIIRNNHMKSTGVRSTLAGTASFLMMQSLDEGIKVVSSSNNNNNNNNNNDNPIKRIEISGNRAQFSMSQNVSIIYSPDSMMWDLNNNNNNQNDDIISVTNNTILLDSLHLPRNAALLMVSMINPILLENNILRVVSSTFLQGQVTGNEIPMFTSSNIALLCFGECGMLSRRSASSSPLSLLLEATIRKNVLDVLVTDNNNNHFHSNFFDFGSSSSSASSSSTSSSTANHQKMTLDFIDNIFVKQRDTSTQQQQNQNSDVLLLPKSTSSLAQSIDVSFLDLRVGPPCNRIAFDSEQKVSKVLLAPILVDALTTNSSEVDAHGDESCLSASKTFSKTFSDRTPSKTHSRTPIPPTTTTTTTTTITNTSTTTTTTELFTTTTTATATSLPTNETNTTTTEPPTSTTTNLKRSKTKTKTKSISHPVPPVKNTIGLAASQEEVQQDLARSMGAVASAFAAPTAALATIRGLAVFSLIGCQARGGSRTASTTNDDEIHFFAGLVVSTSDIIPIFLGVIGFALILALLLGLHNEHLRREREERERQEEEQEEAERMMDEVTNSSTATARRPPTMVSNNSFRRMSNNTNDPKNHSFSITSAPNLYFSDEDIQQQQQHGLLNPHEHDSKSSSPSFFKSALKLAPFPAIVIKFFAVLLPWWSVAAGLLIGDFLMDKTSSSGGRLALGLVPLIIMLLLMIGVSAHLHKSIFKNPHGPRIVRSLAYRPPGAGSWTQSIVEFFLSPFGRFMLSGWYTWQTPKTKNFEELMKAKEVLEQRKNGRQDSNKNNNDSFFALDLQKRIETERKQRETAEKLLVQYRQILTKFWGPWLETEIEGLKQEATVDLGISTDLFVTTSTGATTSSSSSSPTITSKRFNVKGSGLDDLHDLNEVVVNERTANRGRYGHHQEEDDFENHQRNEDPGAPTGFCSNFGNPNFSSPLYHQVRELLCPHFIAISSIFAVAIGVLQGIAVTLGDQVFCEKSILAIAILNLVCWILSIVLRPYIVPFKNFVIIIVDTVIMVTSFIALAASQSGKIDEFADVIAPIQLVVALTATIGSLLLLLLTLIKFFCMRVFGLGMVPRVQIIRRAAEELKKLSLIAPQYLQHREDQNQQKVLSPRRTHKDDDKRRKSLTSAPNLNELLLDHSTGTTTTRSNHRRLSHNHQQEQPALLKSPKSNKHEITSSSPKKSLGARRPSSSHRDHHHQDVVALDDYDDHQHLLFPSSKNTNKNKHNNNNTKGKSSYADRKNAATSSPNRTKEEGKKRKLSLSSSSTRRVAENTDTDVHKKGKRATSASSPANTKHKRHHSSKQRKVNHNEYDL